MEAALERHRSALFERRLDAVQGAARLAIRLATEA
jgi:hypothetical protein